MILIALLIIPNVRAVPSEIDKILPDDTIIPIVLLGKGDVYCALEGCTMKGDLNMAGHDIINVTWVNMTYVNITYMDDLDVGDWVNTTNLNVSQVGYIFNLTVESLSGASPVQVHNGLNLVGGLYEGDGGGLFNVSVNHTDINLSIDDKILANNQTVVSYIIRVNDTMKGYVDSITVETKGTNESENYLYNDTSNILFNETNLNITVNAIVVDSNSSLKSYVDTQDGIVNTSILERIQSNISDINLTIKGYTDERIVYLNTSLLNLVYTNLTAVNLSMKGYVDSIELFTYSDYFDQNLNTTSNVTFNNLTVTQNLSVSNITGVSKIIMGLGEIIQNVVDGFIEIFGDLTVHGDLNVTDNTFMNGYLHVGDNISPSSSAFFKNAGNIYAGDAIWSHRGYAGNAASYGIGILMSGSASEGNLTSFGQTATMTPIGSGGNYEGLICDTTNPFQEEHEGMFLTATSCIDINLLGATGKIKDYINSSCIIISLAALGRRDFGEVTGCNYYVYEHPIFSVLDEGDIHFGVGEHVDSSFKIHIPNGTGARGVHIEDTAGASSHQAFTIDMDGKGYDGIVAFSSLIYTSNTTVKKTATHLLLETDATNVTNGTAIFLDAKLIGEGSPSSEIDLIRADANINNLIKVGGADVINNSWFENTTGIYNMTGFLTSTDNNTNIFQEDNSVLYIGDSGNFTDISISLITVSSHNLGFNYSYCNNSGGWESLGGVTDTTDGFKVSGTISFVCPNNRGECNTSLFGTPFPRGNKHYIALQRTINNIIQIPLENSFSISGSKDSFLLTKELLKLSPTDTPDECCALVKGGIYMDDSDNLMYFCDGTNWVAM